MMKWRPLKCKKHPRYKVMRRPRAACEDCFRMWIAKQDAQPAQPNQSCEDQGREHEWVGTSMGYYCKNCDAVDR